MNHEREVEKLELVKMRNFIIKMTILRKFKDNTPI